MIAVGFFQVQWSARCRATLLSLHRASEGSQKELGAPLNPDARGEYRADIFKVLELPRALMREPLVESN
jgi:hypothetical protein